MEGASDEPEKTITEVVKMLENGSLHIATDARIEGGPHAANAWIAAPGTPDFIEFGERHGLTKTGEISIIKKLLTNGEWSQTQERRMV
ncbi:hypothetical protein BH10CYA1_BH10CYA1_03120 [soil metagenome]